VNLSQKGTKSFLRHQSLFLFILAPVVLNFNKKMGLEVVDAGEVEMHTQCNWVIYGLDGDLLFEAIYKPWRKFQMLALQHLFQG
jgi:hypothetical protein